MKLARRPATCCILLIAGTFVFAGCANSSLGRLPTSQATSLTSYKPPVRPEELPPPAAVPTDVVPAVSWSEESQGSMGPAAGFGLVQPVSLESAQGQAVLLPVPLTNEEAQAFESIAEVTPPLAVGSASTPGTLDDVGQYMAAEPYVEEYAPEVYSGEVVEHPTGLLAAMFAKKHEKKEYRQTLKDMSLAGKPAKHKKKERRDIGYNNPYIGRELRMKSHPLYVVEPPDVLYIEALQLLPERPVMGERLVRQDGTISLGYYGQIHVAGLTLFEIEQKIRERLSEYVQDPQVYVDVAAFNSKVYYVLGQVQQTGRLPITGKETVLDAITLAGGLTNFAKIKDIHVARPNPGGGCDQILHVDYLAITECADTRTNYQLMPGDRVVVPSTQGFKTNVFFDNFLTPFERLASLGSLIRFALD